MHKIKQILTNTLTKIRNPEHDENEGEYRNELGFKRLRKYFEKNE